MTAAERERLFVDLFERNRSRLLRLCAAYAGSAADADDLFQDVMVNVWNGLPSFRGDASASTWLYRITVNTALMWRRSRARETRVIVHSVDAASAARAVAASPSDPDERTERMRRAIAALPAKERVCLTLHLEGISYKEIAAITGMTVNYVGVRISRAKRAVEARMKGDDRGPV